MESEQIKKLMASEEQVNIKVSQAMKEKVERLKSIKKESEEELNMFRKTQSERFEKEIIEIQKELKSKSEESNLN